MRIPLMLAALSLLAGCSASAGGNPAMSTYGYAFPPPAFNTFCATNRVLCSTTGGQKTVSLTPQLKAELQAVNLQVNRTVLERNEVGDRWQIAGASGDCEDIAIRKKSELMKRGWPASVLLLTVVRPTFGDAGHTILTVRTSEGDLIMDNMTSSVRNWSKTHYRYFARQSQANPGRWDQIR